MILFLHAAHVSLDATEAALARLDRALRVRHALALDLVDPNAMTFSQDDAAYARLKTALMHHLHGDETRVVLSCSVFNGFASRLGAELGLPVERSDDAGTHLAIARGPRIGLAVSYPPSYDVVASHLVAVAAERGRPVVVAPLIEENAFAFAGDPERYSATLAAAAAHAAGLDCVYLAQFSMDPHAAKVARSTKLPVVSALAAAIDRLSDPLAPSVERN
jgi:hypothetical protein